MKQTLTAFVVLLALAPTARVAPGQTADESSIRRVVRQHDETRNRGDWKAYGALFTKDADQLTSSGTWRTGSADIEKATAEITATTYKGGKFTTTIDRVRTITPNVAIVDGTFEISNIAGAGSRKGRTTLVLVSSGGEWRIAATRSMVPTPAGALSVK